MMGETKEFRKLIIPKRFRDEIIRADHDDILAGHFWHRKDFGERFNSSIFNIVIHKQMDMERMNQLYRKC